MNGAIVSKIHAARVELRDRGENETYEAINALTGCSKSTIKKYLAASDPATYAPAGSTGSVTITAPRETVPSMTAAAAAPKKKARAAAAAPVGPSDAEFEASFEQLMAARTRYFVCQEILGDHIAAEYTRSVQRREGTHGLWSDHPLVLQIAEAYDTAYDEHLELWQQMVPPSPYAYRGWREPAPKAAPAPKPASTQIRVDPARAGNPSADYLPVTPPPPPRDTIPIDELRRYFQDQIGHGGFGLSTRLDERELPALEKLHEECEVEAAQAGRERFALQGNQELMRHAPQSDERRPYRIVEARWQKAREMGRTINERMQMIKSDMRDYGRTL